MKAFIHPSRPYSAPHAVQCTKGREYSSLINIFSGLKCYMDVGILTHKCLPFT